jgi:hypothetical protein
MARTCACCRHPQCSELDAALLANSQTLKVLSLTYSVSAFSLSRHKKHLISVPSIVGNEKLDSQEIARWLQKAEQVYEISASQADVRGQVSAIGAALKSLEMRARAKEREAEVAEIHELPHSPTIKWNDRDVEAFRSYLDWVMNTTPGR